MNELIIEDLPSLSTLILERSYFEINVYDYLLSDVIGFIPDDFWDPVPVGLKIKQIRSLNTIYIEDECNICAENKEMFKEMNCCKKNICSSCVDIWFKSSVKCPYCVQDLRNFIK